jgi:hypothetical protein
VHGAARSLFVCVLVASLSACRQKSYDNLGDKPNGAFLVLAVFIGCRPPSADVVLPECPQDSSRTCQERYYWCRRTDGARNGPWIRLSPGGERSLQIEYRDGRRHGFWTQWYESGQKWKTGEYNQGREHGCWDGWYRNRQQSYHHEYKNGYPSGHWTHWDEEGTKVEEATYR